MKHKQHPIMFKNQARAKRLGEAVCVAHERVLLATSDTALVLACGRFRRLDEKMIAFMNSLPEQERRIRALILGGCA